MSGIIGHLADSGVGIIENYEGRYFEFYIAGYSKTCQETYVQGNHVKLFSDAIKINNPNTGRISSKKDFLWPFGNREYNIASVILEPELNNKYDRHALVVKVEYPLYFDNYIMEKSGEKTKLVMGYVPKKISCVVSQNLKRIKKGWIKKVRHLGRHCVTKVAIPWTIDASAIERNLVDRLSNIFNEMEEIDE